MPMLRRVTLGLCIALLSTRTAKFYHRQPYGLLGMFKGGLWEMGGPLGRATAEEIAADAWAADSEEAAAVPGRMLGQPTELAGKLAVVTGANTGLGKETARVLAARGAHVVLACRDEERCRDAASEVMAMDAEDAANGGSAEVRTLDLASLASVRGFAEGLLTKLGREGRSIDYLVNNAGVMALPRYEASADGYERQFAVNHLGHFFLTTLLLPALSSPGGRVINLSSLAHTLPPPDLRVETLPLNASSYDPWWVDRGVLPYGISKACNILFSLELRKRLAGRGVGVAAVHPGIVPTELGRYNALAQLGSYDAGIPLLQLLLRRQYLKTVGQGAATTLCAMLHELPTTAQPGDRATDALYWADCEPVSPDDAAAGRCGPSHRLRRSLPSHSSLRGGAHLVLRMFTGLVLDEGKAAALWARSEALVRQALDGEGDGGARYDWPDPLKLLGTASE